MINTKTKQLKQETLKSQWFKTLKLLVSYGKFISEEANTASNRANATLFKKTTWLLTGLCAFFK